MEKKKERKRRIKDRGDPIRPRINPIEEEGMTIAIAIDIRYR